MDDVILGLLGVGLVVLVATNWNRCSSQSQMVDAQGNVVKGVWNQWGGTQPPVCPIPGTCQFVTPRFPNLSCLLDLGVLIPH
jgi:hypothetical protein